MNKTILIAFFIVLILAEPALSYGRKNRKNKKPNSSRPKRNYYDDDRNYDDRNYDDRNNDNDSEPHNIPEISNPSETQNPTSEDDNSTPKDNSNSGGDSTSTSQGSDFISQCLDNQNSFRRPLGMDDLTWSSDLAGGAQQWAEKMASTSNFGHSPKSNYGENIVMGTKGMFNTVSLVERWTNEKKYFIEGCTFPACSTTGSWEKVAHYTQIIWRDTKQVGCGIASNSRDTYLCCRYLKAGNWNGQKVY